MFEGIANSAPEKSKKKFPNVDREISESLEQIDFNELRDVFSKMIRSVGLDPEKNITQFVSDSADFRKRSVLTDRRFGADYSLAEGKISFHWATCKKDYEELVRFGGDNNEDIKSQYILKFLCHEEAHAVSYHELSFSSTGLLSRDIVAKSGYSVTKVNVDKLIKWKKDYIYHAINEAITECVARNVFFEYRKRKNENVDEGILFSRIYEKEIDMFTYLTDSICDECGIEPEILWQVILRGYFAGEDLSGDRMKKLFKNVFPENFEKELAAWRAGQDGERQESVFELIKQMKFTDDDKKRIRRWIMQIHQKMPASQGS